MTAGTSRMGWWSSPDSEIGIDFPLDLTDLSTIPPSRMKSSRATSVFAEFKNFADYNFSSDSLITMKDCDYDWEGEGGTEPSGRSGFVLGCGRQDDPSSYVAPHHRYLYSLNRLHNAADFRAWLMRMGDTQDLPEQPGRREMMGHIRRHTTNLIDAVEKQVNADGLEGDAWPSRINLKVGHHQGVRFKEMSLSPSGERHRKVWEAIGNWESIVSLNSGHSFRGISDIVVSDADADIERAKLGFPAGYESQFELAKALRNNPHGWPAKSLPSGGLYRCAPQALREVAMLNRIMQIIGNKIGHSGLYRGGLGSMAKANGTSGQSGKLEHIYEMMRIVHVDTDNDGLPTSYIASSMGEFVSPAMEPNGFGGEAYGQSIPLFSVPVSMVGGHDDFVFGDWIVIGTHAIPGIESDEPHKGHILSAVHGINGVYDVMKPTDKSRSNTVLIGIRDKVINPPHPMRTTTEHFFSPAELMHMAVASERVVRTHTVSESKTASTAADFIPTFRDNRAVKTLNIAGRKKVRLHDVVRCSVCNGRVEVRANIENIKTTGECPHCGSENAVHFPHLVMGADIPKTGSARQR